MQNHIAEKLNHTSNHMVIDSVSVPAIQLARERSYRAFRRDFESAPAIGYCAVNKSWFIGYKLHVVIYDNDVVQQSGLNKGNVHDITYLKEVKQLPSRKMLFGDRAYISKLLQASFFDDFEVTLKVPF
jgi:Transposase DDE domain